MVALCLCLTLLSLGSRRAEGHFMSIYRCHQGFLFFRMPRRRRGSLFVCLKPCEKFKIKFRVLEQWTIIYSILGLYEQSTIYCYFTRWQFIRLMHNDSCRGILVGGVRRRVARGDSEEASLPWPRVVVRSYGPITLQQHHYGRNFLAVLWKIWF